MMTQSATCKDLLLSSKVMMSLFRQIKTGMNHVEQHRPYVYNSKKYKGIRSKCVNFVAKIPSTIA